MGFEVLERLERKGIALDPILGEAQWQLSITERFEDCRRYNGHYEEHSTLTKELTVITATFIFRWRNLKQLGLSLNEILNDDRTLGRQLPWSLS